MSRCQDCDLILATDRELNEHADDCECCDDLCWRIANPGNQCMRPHVDWRSRAGEFKAAAVHWAEAYARECRRP